MLPDNNVNMTTRREILEACVKSRPPDIYGVQAWLPTGEEVRKMKECSFQCFSNMVNGGWRRRNLEEGEYQLKYSNHDMQNNVKTTYSLAELQIRTTFEV